MKLGIFGGSFNPPHIMHENIAKFLVENKYLDNVIFVPTGNKYEKKDLIDFKHRYNMLKLIIDKYPYLKLSDYESKKERIYTCETLAYYKKLYPNDEIFFVCGIDNLKDFKSWKNYEYILDNYKILVIERNNDILSDIIKNFRKWKNNILRVDIKANNLSSSSIRESFHNNIYNENLVQKEVIKYIKKNHLYEKE